MSESAGEAPVTGAEQQAQDGTATEPDWKAEAEKWKGLARKHEDQWKANAGKVAEYDKLVEASKTDQQRLEDRATSAEGRVAGLEAENLRFQVGLAKGVPAELIGRLQGSTQEELEKDADTLLAQFANARPGVPDLRAAAGPRSVSTEQSPDEWLRNLRNGG